MGGAGEKEMIAKSELDDLEEAIRDVEMASDDLRAAFGRLKRRLSYLETEERN